MKPLPDVPPMVAVQEPAEIAMSDGTASSAEEELAAEFLPPTLPLPGAPRPKALPRPPALRPQRHAHPPPPTPVSHFDDIPPWARPFAWNFGFTWLGELSAWVIDDRHGEVNLINPITHTFVTSGSYNVSPPTPLGTVAVWRDVSNVFNRRWTLVHL